MTKVGQMSDEPRDESLATPAWAFIADTGAWDAMHEAPAAGITVGTTTSPASVDGLHAAETSPAQAKSMPARKGATPWAERDTASDPQVEEVGVVPVLICLPDLSKLPPEVPKASAEQAVIRESRSPADAAAQPDNAKQPGKSSQDRESQRETHPQPPRSREASQGPPSLPRATVRGDLPPLEALLRRRPSNRRRATILAAMFGLMIVTGVVIVHYRASLGPAGGRASRRAKPVAAEPVAKDAASRNGTDAIRPLPDPNAQPSTGNDMRRPPLVRTAEQSSGNAQDNIAALPRDGRSPTHYEQPSADYPHTDPATYLFPSDDRSGGPKVSRAGFAEGTRQPAERQPKTREPGVASLRGIIETVPFNVRR